MLPLSLAFIVLGTITLSTVNSNRESAFPRSDNSGFLSTEVQDLLAQNAPEPPRPTAIPTTVPTSPPAPTTAPILSCNSAISFSGSGQNLTYRLAVNVTSPNISRTVLTINSQYLSNGTLGLVEFSGNCQQNNSGGFTCNRLGSSAQIFFKVENDSYRGPVNFQIKTVIDSGEAFERQEVNCDASFNVEGVNTPPSGMPIYLPGQPIPMNPFAPAENCEPLKDYCTPGSNLLDDGSFENPICTLNPDGVIPQISGKGCSAMNDQPTYYQADISSLIPIRSMAFFTEGGSDRFGRPEYVVQEVSGGQQCEEKLLSHGNNSLKIFSGGGYGLKGGLCLPIKSFGSQATAGINYRVSQQTPNVGQNVPVTFRIGYVNRPMNNNFYWRTQPELNESQITWVSSQTKTNSDYGSEEGAADRYTGGFLTGNVPAGSTGLCFMAESVGGVGINTFWDSAFVTTDGNACEDATNHSDGVDRSCGGWGCGGVEPTYSGNSYTDFDQEYYPFEMPPHWRARQCHFETITNGAPSPYGTLFVGLDMNSCDLNYRIESQRNLHPEWYKPDVACSSDRNWTYGYAWIGGIKDFGMLQYLDCAMGKLDDPEFKGTESNPFYCDQILNSFSNTRNRALLYEDPAFTLRYTNTYSGLVNAVQGESRSNFWKVPLLGSAVSSGVINNRQIEELRIDPFLIGKRNSGSGLNNYMKFNLEDFVISLMIRTEEHLFEDSIIPKNEVMVESLLAKGPVCTNIQGDPISKIHYGPADMVSDRAVFGFADDEGSFEHIIHAENNEVTPEELCNYQFREDRVVGATCTFFQIGEGKNVTFTEDNINSSLLDMGFVSYRAVPTLPPPAPSGIPQPGIGNCNKANLCGQEFGCEDTMRQLYDACIGSREVNEIGGNTFIRQELPNGWDHLQVFGLNKTLEAIWHNEYIQYNQVIRHENVGIDINQVVSIYDQQQPKCSIMPDDRKPVYCDDDADPQAASVKDKAAQVCRRVSPYNCGCSSDNFLTCLLECKTDFVRPPDLATVGIAIEGEPQPTPVPDPNSVNYRITDTSIRAILNNSYPSFLEQFVRILEPKTYEGEGGFNYEEGQIYNYDPRYTGGFLLANTGSGATQCTTDTGAGTKTGVSQVRIENYFAYMGQVPRMNERIGFAATNNKDPNTYQGVIFDADDSDVSSLISRIVRGEGEQYLALPYCDLLTPAEQQTCHMDTDTSCDCIIRTCQEQFDSKVMLMKEYLPLICKKLAETPGNDYHQRSPAECYSTISEHWMKNIINPAKEICDATPKSNKNFNCDPMANYLISQGFDSPELHHAKCEYIENADDVNKYDQCFPIDYELTGLVNPLLGERNQQGGWMLNQCYGPTSEEQREGYPAFTPADLALVEQCRSLNPALGLFTNAYYASDFGNFHNGIDLDSSPANQNIPIYSAGTGRVILIKETDGSREGYGNQIIIDHDGVYTRYAHLDDFIKADGSILKEGDVVTRDTQIGHMGNTGNSTSTHLHFEVLRCL